MWICGRSWTTLRFPTPPQCKPKTTLPDASWMKLLDPDVLGTSTNKHKETWSVPTQPMRYRFRLPRECSSAKEPFRLGSGSERHVGPRDADSTVSNSLQVRTSLFLMSSAYYMSVRTVAEARGAVTLRMSVFALRQCKKIAKKRVARAL